MISAADTYNGANGLSVPELLQQSAQGDREKIDVLIRHVQTRLERVVRKRIHKGISHLIEPDVIVQEVLISIFTTNHLARLARFDTEREFLMYVYEAVHKKIAEVARYWHSKKRLWKRVQALSEMDIPDQHSDRTSDNRQFIEEILAPGQKGLHNGKGGDDTDRIILEMTLEGSTPPEIANHLKMDPTAIRRRLAAIRNSKRVEEMRSA